MNPTIPHACGCIDCPGAGCTCGCQAGNTHPAVAANPPACRCGPGCGCEGAEQGCLCGHTA